jgi:hypothetical protein
MLVKDNWGKVHRVNDKYDNQDIIIEPNHVFQELTPTNILSRTAYNQNRSSTRVNEARHVTLKIEGPSFHQDGRRIGKGRKTNW